MKILTYAHQLEIGGTQTNALDLATYLRDRRGHDPIFFAEPGPMARALAESAIPYRPAPSGPNPSRSIVSALRRVIREEQPDVLHVWDHWQYVNAVFAAASEGIGSILMSDMISGTWPRTLPRKLLTTFGTPELTNWARTSGLLSAEYLPPPVNLERDHPDQERGTLCRDAWGVSDGEFLIVVVSRLEHSLKMESLMIAIEAVRGMGTAAPVRLVIVGDGPARSHLEESARDANALLRRTAVVLPGSMLDPRPAYAAADAVIGMGGSAIRGMAHRKPVIIVGTKGFASVVDSETAPHFEYAGMYGVGEIANDIEPTRNAIARLMNDKSYAVRAAADGFEFARRAYSVEIVGSRLEELYERVRAHPATRQQVMLEMAHVIRRVSPQRGKDKARTLLPASIRRAVAAIMSGAALAA